MSPTAPAPVRPLASAVAATAASVYPAFLVGAVGGELRDDLGFGEAASGLLIGVYFLCAAALSTGLGRTGERLGARRALRVGLAVTATVQIAIAAVADRWWMLAVGLVLAGAANALNQPAANLFLTRTIPTHHMGLAVAVKQSGMPAGTMLGGLAVPVLALTLGWRWTFVAGAVLAVGAALAVPRVPEGPATRPAASTRSAGELSTPLTVLGLLALGMIFGAAAAGGLAAWVPGSAENAGMGRGTAGLMLTVGSLAGIGLRVTMGLRADRVPTPPLRTVATMLTIGSVGMLALGVRSPITTVVAVLVAFGAGWAWPGLFNLAVLRANPDAPARATGITQTGTYLGAFLGPTLVGAIIDTAGYPAAWTATAGLALMGAATMRWGQHRLAAVGTSAPHRQADPDRAG